MAFHISTSGAVVPCQADVRACPRGGAEVHFESAQEAAMAALNGPTYSVKSQGRDHEALERVVSQSTDPLELQRIAEQNTGDDDDLSRSRLDETLARNEHLNEQTALIIARRSESNWGSFSIDYLLIQNHDSPAVLDVLSQSRNLENVERVAYKKQTAATTLQRIADRIPNGDDKWDLQRWSAIATAVVGNENADAAVLRTVARKAIRFRDVRHGLAYNKNTPIEVLDRLTRSKDVGVTAWVAMHPNTDEKILRKLYKNSELNTYGGQLAREIIEARAVPHDLLLDCAREGKGVNVLTALASAPTVSKDVLQALATRESYELRGELPDDDDRMRSALIKNAVADDEVITAAVKNRDLSRAARSALMERDPDLYEQWLYGLLDDYHSVVQRSV